MCLKRLFEAFALRHAAPHVFNDGFKSLVLGLTRENLKNVVQRDARRVKRTELLREKNEFPGGEFLFKKTPPVEGLGLAVFVCGGRRR